MRLLLVALALSACSSALSACSSRATAPTPAADMADLAMPADDLASRDDLLPVPAPAGTYSGAVTVPSSMSVDYAGTDPTALVTAVHITDSVGTVDFQGTTYPAVAYVHIPFGTYDLAAIVGTTDSGFFVTYAYCMQGVLDDLYTESLMLAPTDEASMPMGTCSFTDGSTPLDAAFTQPAALAYAAPVDVADVDGADLVIHGGTGTVTIAGTTYDLDVFTTVDCSQCGGAGWQELHTTITDGASVLAFAIFYLEAGSTSTVQLDYGFRFDEPALWPPDQLFSATWTLK